MNHPLSILHPTSRGPAWFRLNGTEQENLLDCLALAYGAGLRGAALDKAGEMVAAFYNTDTHRCAACLAWSKQFRGRVFIADGKLNLTVICDRCTKLGEAGKATPTMIRNVQGYALALDGGK
jgi:hypothetical protein